MPKITKLETKADTDRLTKWRAERLLAAETQKQERLRARDADRKELEERERLKRIKVANALLPTEEEVQLQAASLIKAQSRRSNRAWLNFILLVMLPVFASAYYLTQVATPLYQATAVITVSKTDSAGVGASTGLFNTQRTSNNLHETFVAQAYIQSPAMMAALEEEQGLITRWSGSEIDPIARLRDVERLHLSKATQFDRFVNTRIDVQTGLLTITVRDPDPIRVTRIAERVVSMTDQHLWRLNGAASQDQLRLSQDAVATAKLELTKAQNAVLVMQLESGEANPRMKVEATYERIAGLEAEVMALEDDISKAQIAGRGESFLSRQTQEMKALKEAALLTEQESLTRSLPSQPSLNTILMDYDRAQLEVRMAQDVLENALTSLTVATRAAAQNQSLLMQIVPPTAQSTPVGPQTLPILLLVLLLSVSAFVFVQLLWSNRFDGRR